MNDRKHFLTGNIFWLEMFYGSKCFVSESWLGKCLMGKFFVEKIFSREKFVRVTYYYWLIHIHQLLYTVSSTRCWSCLRHFNHDLLYLFISNPYFHSRRKKHPRNINIWRLIFFKGFHETPNYLFSTENSLFRLILFSLK